MRPLFHLLFLLIVAPVCEALPVVLPEDEFLLPPLFSKLEAREGGLPDGFNVITASGTARRAIPGEWFDYQDVLEVPPDRAIQVLQNERLAWVGGGVFRGKLGKYPVTDSNLVQYSLELLRGWIKVWIKPGGSADSYFRVEAHGESFFARDAEFWLNSTLNSTELYVVRGEVKTSKGQRTFPARTFLLFPPKSAQPTRSSQDWDDQAMEVRIAQNYPALVKLAGVTKEEWSRGKTSEIYSNFRKNGWRKAHRFTPILRK